MGNDFITVTCCLSPAILSTLRSCIATVEESGYGRMRRQPSSSAQLENESDITLSARNTSRCRTLDSGLKSVGRLEKSQLPGQFKQIIRPITKHSQQCFIVTYSLRKQSVEDFAQNLDFKIYTFAVLRSFEANRSSSSSS